MLLSFVVLYGKEIEVPNPGYFFICMAIGDRDRARLFQGGLVDHGKIHVVSIVSLVSLAISFSVFATRTYIICLFRLLPLAIGIGFGVSVPAFQCLFVNVAPAPYARYGHFYLLDLFRFRDGDRDAVRRLYRYPYQSGYRLRSRGGLLPSFLISSISAW